MGYRPIIRTEVTGEDSCIGLGRVLRLDGVRVSTNAVLRAVAAGVTVANELNLTLRKCLSLTQFAVELEAVERGYTMLTFHAALDEQTVLFLVTFGGRVEHERLVLAIQTDDLVRVSGKRAVNPQVELYRLNRRGAQSNIVACEREACIGRAVVEAYAVGIGQCAADIDDAAVISLVHGTCLHA